MAKENPLFSAAADLGEIVLRLIDRARPSRALATGELVAGAAAMLFGDSLLKVAGAILLLHGSTGFGNRS